MATIIAGRGLGLFTDEAPHPGVQVWLPGRGQHHVNVVNGNLVLQSQDERLSGRGPDLVHCRSYNSQAAWDDADGDGWRWDAERRMTVQGQLNTVGASVTRIGGDGRQRVHHWDTAKAGYLASEGIAARQDSVVYDEPRRELVRVEGSSQHEERYAGATRRFKSEADATGNSVLATHDAQGRPVRLADLHGRQQLTLHYDTGTAPARLRQVDAVLLKTDAEGRATRVPDTPYTPLRYSHDDRGRLATVAQRLDPAGGDDERLAITGYTYDDAGRRIVAIAHADGSSTEFGYDADGRVARVTDAAGSVHFSYHPDDYRTDVTDASGQTWSYGYDTARRLTTLQGPPPQAGGARPTQRWTYDDVGRVLRHEDALGQARSFEYDARGDLVLERDALGQRTLRRYDDRHQVLTITQRGADDAALAATTRQVYDERARLRFVISPEGRVTEHRHGSGTAGDGHLRQTLRYTAARFDVGTLAPDEAPSLAAMQAWQRAQDPSQVMQTLYEHDARGNPARRVDPARSDAQGLAVIDAAAQLTEFVHGARGELLRTAALRGADRTQRQLVASAAYDGIGRLIGAEDAAGPRTTVHDSSARQSRTENAAGLVQTLAFDTCGRCVSETSTDSRDSSAGPRITRQVHDEAGRLRLVEDAQGARRFLFYDSHGRLAHNVDREGAVTGHTYDAAGRPVRTTLHASRANTAGWFDGTRVVKAQLLVGGPGADVEVDPANDRSTSFRHDAAGRLVERTDAEGLVTRWQYDAQSRIVEQRSGDRCTRYVHDRDGLPIGEIDAQGHLTERRYDAAGRCVQILRYAERGAAAIEAVTPVWEAAHEVTATAGQPLHCRLPAPWAPDGSAVSVVPVGELPPGLHWNPTALMLTGIAPAQPGTLAVLLRAQCGEGEQQRSVQTTLTLNVQRAAPSWGPLPDLTLPASDLDVVLELPAAEPAGGAWVYSLRSPLPAGLAFDAAARRLHGRLAQPGLYALSARVAHAEDQTCHSDASFTLHVANRGPVWSAGLPLQQAVRTQPFALAVPPAADADGQPLRYRIVDAPAWLDLADETRPTLAGTPPADALAPALHAVVLEAEDTMGEVARLTFTIEVLNAAPQWVTPLPPAAPVVHGQPLDHLPPAAVDPEGGAVSYRAVAGLPSGLAVDPATGRLSGRSPAVGSFDVTLEAQDADGGRTQRSLRITLLNLAPAYQRGLPDLQMMKGNPIGGTVPADAFSDPEGDALSPYRIRGAIPGFMPGVAPGLYFHVGSGVWRFHDPSAPVGAVIPITVEVTDAHGAIGQHTFNITVIPVPTSPPPPPPPPPEPGPGLPKGRSRAAAHRPTAAAASAPLPDPLAAWRPSAGEVRSCRYFHDGLGREVARVDEAGYYSETVYDETLHLQRTLRYPQPVAVADGDTPALLRGRAGAAQQALQVEFDRRGRPIRETGPDGSVSLREYDAAGRLVRELQAAGTPEQRGRRWRFNGFGELTGEVGGEGDAAEADTDAAIAGHGLRHAVDSLGRRASSTDALGRTRWTFYDREGRVTHTVNAEGEVATTRYNTFGQPVQVCRHARRLDLARDGAALRGGAADAAFLARVAALADPAQDSVNSFAYDRRGLLVQHTDGEGAVTLHSYTAHGQLALQQRSDAPGRTLTQRYAYDRCGRELLKIDDAGGSNANQRQAWDGFGRLVASTDAAGHTTTLDYPEQGRVTVATDALGRSLRTEHDHEGRAVARVDALGRRTQMHWDAAERRLTVRSPLGHEVVTTHSRHGEVVSVVQGGQRSSYRHDRDGRLVEVVDALGQVIERHSHDAAGRRVQSVDAVGTVTTTTYDRADRVTGRCLDPSGLALRTAYEHDAFGRVTRTVESQGEGVARVVVLKYDREDRRVAQIVDPDGLALLTRWRLDGLGREVGIERGVAGGALLEASQRRLDGLGRVVVETTAPSAVFGPGAAHERDLRTRSHHDAAGRVSCVLDALGHASWVVHDAAGQAVQAIDAEGGVTSHVYGADGRLRLTRRHAVRLDDAALAALGTAPAPLAITPAAGDACTRFVHDADGRLCHTLQALGEGRWVVQENRHDMHGRVIEWRAYDRGIRLVPEGTPDLADNQPLAVDQVAAQLRAAGYDDQQPESLAQLRRQWFVHDANGRQRYAIDAQGGVSESVFDAAGRTVEQLRHATRVAVRAHTEGELAGLLNRAHDDNRRSCHVHDAAGRIAIELRSLDHHTHLASRREHGALGELRRVHALATPLVGPIPGDRAALQAALQALESPQDRITEFDVDAAGRVCAQRQRLTPTRWRITEDTRDALGRVQRSVARARLVAGPRGEPDAADRISEQVFDAAGRLRFVVAPDGALTEHAHDATGRPVLLHRYALCLSPSTPRTLAALTLRRGARRVGDGVTRGEERIHDRAGRLVGLRCADGRLESHAYDALGRRCGFIDKAGAEWRYEHDVLGRLVRQWSPQVEVQGSEQDAARLQALCTHDELDVFGNLLARHEAAGSADQRSTRYTYDTLNRLVLQTEPGWYDPASGRVEAVDDDAHTRWQRTLGSRHDVFGQCVRRRRSSGPGATVDEHQTFDALGRPVQSVDALGHVLTRGHDAHGDVVTVTRHGRAVAAPPAADEDLWSVATLTAALADDTEARSVRSVFDALGRVVQLEQPVVDSGHASSLLPQVNAAEIAPYSAAPRTSYDYVSAFAEWQCERTSVGPQRSVERWRYVDAAGRSVRDIDTLGHHTLTQYDAFGNVVETVACARPGALGTLASLQPPAPPALDAADRVTRFVHDAMNRQTELQRGGQPSYEPDGAGYRLVARGREQMIVVLRTTYDAMGRVVATEDALGQRTNTGYNTLGQLVRIEEPACAVANADAVDPFRGQAVALPVTTLTLDRHGGVLRQARGGAAALTLASTQCYDAAGAAIERTDAGGTLTRLRYDALGRVAEESVAANATLGDWQAVTQSLTTRHHHDALGRRIATLQVYTDAGQVLQSGSRQRFNVFGELVEEQRVWGAADAPPQDWSVAVLARHDHDAAGRVVQSHAADGVTRRFHDLQGRVTREERRAAVGSDGPARITETGYDALGRAVIRRLPAFDALLDSLGDRLQTVTPCETQEHDRWGNVRRRGHGAYVIHEGGVHVTNDIGWTDTVFDADNRVIAERGPVAAATRADGSSGSVRVQHEWHRDRLGRVVEEADLAIDAASGTPGAAPLRTLRRWLDVAGRPVIEADATGIRTEFAYDLHGRRVGVRNALGTVRVNTYDSAGRLLAHGVLRRDVEGSDPPLDPYAQPYDSRDPAQQPRVIVLARHQIDSAGRRVGSAELAIDGISADLPYGEPHAYWQYQQLDERGLVCATRDAAGTVLRYGHDVLGQRRWEEDANLNRREWLHASNETDTAIGAAGRLIISTVDGDRRTFHEYNGYGEPVREHYSFQTGDRRIEYHANGLPRSINVDVTRGTPGAENLNYMHSVQTLAYDHDPRGRRARERYVNDVSRDVARYEYDPETRRSRRVGIELERSVSGGELWTHNDALGRLQEVKAQAVGDAARTQIQHLRYRHDELGRRRCVEVAYTLPGQAARQLQRWFDHDAQGRLLVADGKLEAGVIVPGRAGSALAYDLLGRRWTSERWLRARSGQTSPDTPGVVYAWDEHHEEANAYNDLGQLVQTDQRVNQRRIVATRNGQPPQGQPYDSIGDWQPSSRRRLDWRGLVLRHDRYSRVAGLALDNTTRARHVGQVVSSYRADSRLRTQWSSVLDDGVHRDGAQTFLNHSYDAAGVLQQYTQHIGNYDGGAGDITHTYRYRYTRAFGGYRPQWLEVTSSADNAITDDVGQVYNEQGQLSLEYVNSHTSNRWRRFSYDGEDRVVTKVQAGAQAGQQDYFHSAGRFLASLGALAGEHFVNGLNPLTEGVAVPASYRVNAGDSLRDIAEAVYGDGQLWHLIADANSLAFQADEPLPAGEQGKSYRVPEGAAAVGNRADSFRAYHPGAIIGDFTPEVVLRPVDDDRPWWASALVTGVTLLIQRAGTAVLTPVMGPVGASMLASAAANAAGQGTAMLLDQRDDFSWHEVTQAGVSGGLTASFSAVPGSGLGHELKLAGAGHLARQGLGAVANGRGFEVDFRGLGASLASTTASYTLKNWSLSREHLPAAGHTLVSQLVASASQGEPLGLATFGRAVGSYLGERAGDRLGSWAQIDWVRAPADSAARPADSAGRRASRRGGRVLLASTDPNFLPGAEEQPLDSGEEEIIHVDGGYAPLTDLERSSLAVWLTGDPLAAQKSFRPGYLEALWYEARQNRDNMRRRAEFDNWLRRTGTDVQRRMKIQQQAALEYQNEVARIRDENSLVRSVGQSSVAFGKGVARGAVTVVYEPVAMGVDLVSLGGAVAFNAAAPAGWEVGTPHMFSSYGKQIERLTEDVYDLSADLSAGEARGRIAGLRLRTAATSALGLAVVSKPLSIAVGLAGGTYGVTMAAQSDTPQQMAGAFGQIVGQAYVSAQTTRIAQRSLGAASAPPPGSAPPSGGGASPPRTPAGAPPGGGDYVEVMVPQPVQIRINDAARSLYPPEIIRLIVKQAIDMHGRTEVDGHEWGGPIYTSASRGPGYRIVKGSTDKIRVRDPEMMATLPDDAVVVGYGHSHPKVPRRSQEEFSYQDMDVATSTGKPFSVITPHGSLKVYVPAASGQRLDGVPIDLAELTYAEAPGRGYLPEWPPEPPPVHWDD